MQNIISTNKVSSAQAEPVKTITPLITDNGAKCVSKTYQQSFSAEDADLIQEDPNPSSKEDISDNGKLTGDVSVLSKELKNDSITKIESKSRSKNNSESQVVSKGLTESEDTSKTKLEPVDDIFERAEQARKRAQKIRYFC